MLPCSLLLMASPGVETIQLPLNLTPTIDFHSFGSLKRRCSRLQSKAKMLRAKGLGVPIMPVRHRKRSQPRIFLLSLEHLTLPVIFFPSSADILFHFLVSSCFCDLRSALFLFIYAQYLCNSIGLVAPIGSPKYDLFMCTYLQLGYAQPHL